MRVESLELTDFRSYAATTLELPPGPCALLGLNGQGKTNLIEAIGYVATLGSHRVASDTPLIRLGAERAVIRAGIVREDRRALVEIEVNPGRANRIQLNRNAVQRPRQVLGVLNTVLFAPEDLAMVKGDPSERRRFLDDLLVALTPRLAAVRADYERVLKQRNALLKTAGAAVRAGRGDLRTLETWDTHLAHIGAELLAQRLSLVSALGPLVDKAYDEVSSGGGPATLAYRSSIGPDLDPGADRETLEAALAAAVLEARSNELDRGISLVGPHRDDLVLSLGPLPARGYASHGESWSFALALRLASYELLRGAWGTGTDPVLILDDVFAELDVHRRSRLAGMVAGAEQVLITAAVPEDVPSELAGARYDVRDGTVNRVG
ncbi:MAG TPA: DNA replication/repair protein RecF [Sporichthyaceae bacterium]|nr:DNA replication/repair protein RecF [Sporichthyaceae bacterium]